jgi:hypothetical protein
LICCIFSAIVLKVLLFLSLSRAFLEFFIESRASITLSLCWGVSVFVFLNFSGLYFLLKNCFVELVESSFFLLFRWLRGTSSSQSLLDMSVCRWRTHLGGFFLMKFPSLMMMMDRVSFSRLLSVTYKRTGLCGRRRESWLVVISGSRKQKIKKIIFIVSDADRLSLLIGQASSFLLSCSFFFFLSVSSRFLSPWRHYRLFNVFFSRLLAPRRQEERERRPVEVLDYI